MTGAHQNPVGTHFSTLKGSASMRAYAVENINFSADVNGPHEAPKDLTNLNFLLDEGGFSDHAPPSHREDTPKFHDNRNIWNYSG